MNRVVIFLTLTVIGSVAAELEHAVQYEPVERVQQLLRSGVPLTANACVLAGFRDAVARYFFLYIREAIERSWRGESIQVMTSADAYQCLDALLVHTADVALVRTLLLAGARVGYKDMQGNTALLSAQQAGYREKEALLRHQAEDVYAQLLMRVQNETLTEDFLRTHFVGLNKLNINRPYQEVGWRTALFVAVMRNYVKGVLLLLRYGAKGVQYALWLAIQRASKKIIQALCEHGARLWAIPGALQTVVTSNKHAENIVPWLAPLVSPRDRKDALIAACLKADECLFAQLTRAGASLYYQDKQGVTPLYAAVLGHNLSLVKTIAAHKKQQLTRDQLLRAKTFFPDAYTLLASSDTTS